MQKGVYPYEYRDDWEKFNETSLPEKEDFYSDLNMKDITDADYAYTKRVCKDFEIKNLGEYHNLFVQSNTLLLERTLEIYAWRYMNLILRNFFQLLDKQGSSFNKDYGKIISFSWYQNVINDRNRY